MNMARINELAAMAKAADGATAVTLHAEIQEEIMEMQNILALVASKLPGPAAAPTEPPPQPNVDS